MEFEQVHVTSAPSPMAGEINTAKTFSNFNFNVHSSHLYIHLNQHHPQLLGMIFSPSN
jgi:hypothetical protein